MKGQEVHVTNPGDKIVKVFIGRFQPFHNGHLKVLRAAIDTSDLVVVVIGSSGAVSTPKNPWGFEERRIMITGALTQKERDKIEIIGAHDMPGDDRGWVKGVKYSVRKIADVVLGRGRKTYTLVGCHKGADTY